MKVKSIDFVARGKVEFREVDWNETLAPDHVLLKTVCTLVSPGTEFPAALSRSQSLVLQCDSQWNQYRPDGHIRE